MYCVNHQTEIFTCCSISFGGSFPEEGIIFERRCAPIRVFPRRNIGDHSPKQPCPTLFYTTWLAYNRSCFIWRTIPPEEGRFLQSSFLKLNSKTTLCAVWTMSHHVTETTLRPPCMHAMCPNYKAYKYPKALQMQEPSMGYSFLLYCV